MSGKELNKSEMSSGEKRIEELFLLHLRYKEATLIDSGGHQPILLNDAQTAWVVYAGRVDLFAVQLKNGRIVGSRQHLFRVEAGEALWGMDFESVDGKIGLLAVGNKDTSLLKLPASSLRKLCQDEEFGHEAILLLEGWVDHLSNCLSSTLPPKDSINLEVGRETAVSDHMHASAKRGILWIEHIQGKSQFMGQAQFTINGNGYTPLSAHTWVETIEDCRIRAQDTVHYLDYDPSWSALDRFHAQFLHHILDSTERILEIDQHQLKNRIESNRDVINDALVNLASPLISSEKHSLTKSEPLILQACRLVTDELGITLVTPPADRLNDPSLNPISEIARISQFQIRRVILKGEWWKQDGGPLVGKWEESKKPVAILPETVNSYAIHDPETGEKILVNDEIAQQLLPFATMIYRPFSSQLISAIDMLKFGLRGRKGELRTIILVAIAVSVLSMIIPIATGLIFDSIIPDGDRTQLIQLGIVMIVIAVAIALFEIGQNISVLRLQSKMSLDLQAAVWTRLVSLPASFFRDYTAGDLGTRVMGINVIQQTLSGPVVYALLAGAFSFFSFLLLFYYSVPLAIVATGLVVISMIVTVVIGVKQVKYQRIMTDAQGEISGTVLQGITGITKFRTSGSEGRAFANWAKEFSYLKGIVYQSRNLSNNLTVFNAGYTILAAMIIFGTVAMLGQDVLSTGDFLAFYAAFTQFFTAMLILSSTIIGAVRIVPVYERAKPILQTYPEIDELKEYPGELSGQIAVNHVSFRYKEDGPLILQDVSIEVNPGEFVALVGSSGSGKSTLFRLLIGFEEPEIGSIFYDEKDLTKLDIREVRRQVGVVLQSGKIMAGDIFNNIVGASTLTLDDAWGAAEMAGLAEDIKAMPMGMHTVIGDGGGTLSGGQRQRLLIARALVNKPRVIFFDEATSALDNRTQAIVSESLDNLKATRIVIAHRLSTVMNADRIYVLENGRIVQNGTYDELMDEEGGLFAELAKRQIA